MKRLVTFAIVAWLFSGAPTSGDTPGTRDTSSAPQELAGLKLPEDVGAFPERCRELGHALAHRNDLQVCLGVPGLPDLIPEADLDACRLAAASLPGALPEPFTPAHLCAPFVVLYQDGHPDRQLRLALYVPVPAGMDLEWTLAQHRKHFQKLWGESWQWTRSEPYRRTRYDGRVSIENAAPMPELPPREQLALAGYIVVEISRVLEEDPYPHGSCRTTGCGCTKRTVCPA